MKPVELKAVSQADPAFSKLKDISRKEDYTGAVIEMKPESGGQCLAFFPNLCTVHEFSREMAPIESFVQSREYFFNSDNTYTRTDLHLAPEMGELIEFFKTAVKFYFEKMAFVYDDFEIVQCWANKTKFHELHHLHRHPNCNISGVFYLDSGGGDTVFRLPNYHDLLVSMHRTTIWNHRAVYFKSSKGRLILFPSSVEHHTSPHDDPNNDRYTVAFNVIVRGEIGDLSKGSWLNL